MASVIEESKESVTDILIERPNEINQVVESSGEPQVSSADIMGGLQGDQHTTVSASSVVVADVSVSTAVQETTSAIIPPLPH
jgi:cytoskeletal protein CcmA (bactofilin family)